MSAVSHHFLTAEEFAALPTDNLRLELVAGEIIAMPPAFDDHGKSTMRLGGLVTYYVLEHDLGEVYAAETGFLLARNPDTVRAPDFAFIRKDRLPSPRPTPGWVEVIPDLVAEVVSSGDPLSDTDFGWIVGTSVGLQPAARRVRRLFRATMTKHNPV